MNTAWLSAKVAYNAGWQSTLQSAVFMLFLILPDDLETYFWDKVIFLNL